jgi:ABC-2 type transport system permease protein
VLIGLSSRNIDTGLTSQEITKTVVGLVLATALWAALGVGLGALVRNQVGAIIGSLVYLFVLEQLLTIIPTVEDIIREYGLGGVSSGLFGADTSSDLLGQVPAGLLFAGYCAAFLAAGIVVMQRRDITA